MICPHAVPLNDRMVTCKIIGATAVAPGNPLSTCDACQAGWYRGKPPIASDRATWSPAMEDLADRTATLLRIDGAPQSIVGRRMDVGIGDTLARIFAWLGQYRLFRFVRRTRCCRCAKRQARYNSTFPYPPWLRRLVSLI